MCSFETLYFMCVYSTQSLSQMVEAQSITLLRCHPHTRCRRPHTACHHPRTACRHTHTPVVNLRLRRACTPRTQGDNHKYHSRLPSHSFPRRTCCCLSSLVKESMVQSIGGKRTALAPRQKAPVEWSQSRCLPRLSESPGGSALSRTCLSWPP